MSGNLTQFWTSLGAAAQGVVALLAVMSLASIAIVLERGVGLWMAQRDTIRFVPLASAAFRSGIFGEIMPLLQHCSLSPEADMVMKSGVDLDVPPSGESEARRRLILARWSVDRYLATVNLDLRRGLFIIGTISATAPFVGLLGTVLGIIRAFQALGRTGTGLAGVSAGIAEALITTALGLMVAIPATWAYNFLTNKVDLTVYHTRRFGALFLETLAAGGGPSTRALLKEKPDESQAVASVSKIVIRSDINVTPLVDVVLVLLIIFMVVTPAPESALDLGISRVVKGEPGNQKERKEQVFVRVTEDQKVFLNDREVAPGSLKQALTESFKGRTGEPLFFEADPGAEYPQVVQILDEASSAGVGSIAIVNRKTGAH